jgi:hypothetical protein
MGLKNMENIILISCMGAEKWNMQVVVAAGGGAHSRRVNGKDTGHISMLMGTDTSDNTRMITWKGMGYTGGVTTEKYITESGNKIRKRAKDFIDGQMKGMNIVEDGKII